MSTGVLVGRESAALPIRPKPIRPSVCDPLRSTSFDDQCALALERSAACGAFTKVTPAPVDPAAAAFYERQLCSLLKRTALAAEPALPADEPGGSSSRLRRSRTPIESANAAIRRVCSACLSSDAQLSESENQSPTSLRSPLSDLVGSQVSTMSSRPPQEPDTAIVWEDDCAAATRKRRRKQTDENAGENAEVGSESDDESACSASPRSDPKFRRRVASLRPSINAEKMLTDAEERRDDDTPCRRQDRRELSRQWNANSRDSQFATQFHVINELDIDQIENN